MDTLLQWYFNLNKFTIEELNILNEVKLNKPLLKNENEYAILEDEYFRRMLFCNISSKDYTISFTYKARDFINEIFKKEVDENTLIISVENEHHSVIENIKQYKDYIILARDNLFDNDLIVLIEKARKYKKVFVYMTGVQLFTGEITPQVFFERLKSEFIKNNIEHKIMLDDVHGMFLVPRDYSLFDYILYTAHSIVDKFDMGMLISKKNNFVFGEKAYNWGKKYLERLDIILKRKDKAYLFKYVLSQYFNIYLANNKILSYYNNTALHIYSIKYKNLYFNDTDCKKLKDLGILINKDISCIRFRIKEFITLNYDEVKERLNYFIKILDKAILINNMKEG